MEVHLVGQVVGARELSARSAHCRWRLIAGEEWKHSKGQLSGETHIDQPANRDGAFVWQHPVDASFEGPEIRRALKGELRHCMHTLSDAHAVFSRTLLSCVLPFLRVCSGWPCLELEVRSVDSHGRSELAGYALFNVPPTPGVHLREVPLWRPALKSLPFAERIHAWFLGGYPNLKDKRLLYGAVEQLSSSGPPDNADGKRSPAIISRSAGDKQLLSTPAGIVHLAFSVCVRNMV